MNTSNMNSDERQAMLDLLIMAMYADGHLATVEDRRLHRVLTAMGLTAEHERSRAMDAAVTRVRRRSANDQATLGYAAELAAVFATPEARQEVLARLDDIASSDGRVVPQETEFLTQVRALLKG